MGPNHCGYFGNYVAPAPSPADEHEAHLRATIGAWLGQRHPEKSGEVLAFITLRLVSHDRPYGHGGDWLPLNEGDGCVLTRCCGTRACAVVEARVESMVSIALRAWCLLAAGV